MTNLQIYRAPRVTVCVLTRNRPVGLTRALQGIAAQKIPAGRAARLRVLVIDNDPDRSAMTVVETLRPNYPWLLEYAVEPAVGIPQARNRALALTIETDDLLIFFDDDQVPCEVWLYQLLRVRHEYSADVVFGPVNPYFPDPVPRWIQRGGFFERARRATGTVCVLGGTGNVLISCRILKESGIRFDEALRFSGGSDTVFFRRIHEASYRMIWAAEAAADEWIPISRANFKWLMMRHFRNGALEGKRWSSLLRRLRAGAVGAGRVIVGGACAVALLPFGKHLSVKAIRWASYGAGILYGLAGKHFEEYRVIRSV
jgi:succinoglycan biosynthesis protein ExoM